MSPVYGIFMLLCFISGAFITFMHFFGDHELSPKTLWFGGLLLGIFVTSVWHT